ncbi:hypothetical protein SZN_12218 [Streptomyces zinciresistens K42]|uniref:Uncharacterized protein n=1 Tax=Streptomyces zinciresistens K42 TaxID=700597 RepID=G2GAC1_9ACTN|nr:hypothetical protein [Streptomyces zinciresistens]EGX59495.1 hypothetical protein SZN_12218 [Streptomyces zinciresistens K42]
MQASQNTTRSGARPCPPVTGVSMSDLLAANAAAELISTPPPAPEPRRHTGEQTEEHREAA